jgi:hypothetical protein
MPLIEYTNATSCRPTRSRKGMGLSSRIYFVLAAVLLLTLSVGVAIASAGKTAEGVIGDEYGVEGGELNFPADVAVNQATGQIYVADTSNHRIQRFDSDGNFELAFGEGVVAPGGSGDKGGTNEVRTVTIEATGGSFEIGLRRYSLDNEAFERTPPIPFDAPASAVQAALEALSTIDPGDVAVTGPAGGPWVVEFTGRYAATRIDNFGLWGTDNLTGPEVEAKVTDDRPESLPVEFCTVASECRQGAGAGNAGGGVLYPVGLALNQATGHLYVADATNRITEFDADGNFVRAWGAGVVAPGGTGDLPSNETQRVRKTPDKNSVPDGGTFALEFKPLDPIKGDKSEPPVETTGPIPLGASSGEVQAALEALPSIAPGDVAVTGPPGGPWEIEFTGAYGDTVMNPLETNNDGLTREGRPEGRMFVERKRAAGGHEVCTIAAQCLHGNVGGDGAGQINGVLFEQVFARRSLAMGPTGHVFVADTANARINEYQGDGAFVRSWGWGVDTEASQFEICTAASGCHRALPAPGGLKLQPGQFATQGFRTGGEMPTQLTVDGAGVVYAANRESNSSGAPPRVERFDSTKATADALLLEPIRNQNPAEGITPGPVPTSFPTIEEGERVIAEDMEIDPSNGNLLYGTRDHGIFEIETAGTPALVDVHLPGAGPFAGFGYGDAVDRLYIAEWLGSRVVIAGASGSEPPAATLADPESTGETTARFSGSVTPGGPEGLNTSYRFEYRKTTETDWTRLPSQDIEIGDGNSAVPVEQAATGLEVGVEYEVRLVATKEFGAGQTITPVKAFTLLPLVPTVRTTYPGSRRATSATLTGLIDPRNSATTYYFEWGTDQSYGNRVPVPDGTLPASDGLRPVTVEITGLSPETTYHYRLFADNGIEESPGDTLVEGEDVAFTTRAATSPPGARAFEMVTPPFKVVRAGTGFNGGVGNNPNPGVPSVSGDSILWNVPFFPLTDEVDAPANNDRRIIRRTAQGWVHETQNTLPLIGHTSFIQVSPFASSGDLETIVVRSYSGLTNSVPGAGGFLPTEGGYANRLYTFRKGTGVEGFNPWLTNPEEQVIDLQPDPELQGMDYAGNGFDDYALINDDGSTMVRWGFYGGLAEDPATAEDDDPSDDQLLAGDMIYLQRAGDPLAMPTAPKDLVNECTGSGPTATRLPARTGGAQIGTVVCEEGQLTHRRGAVVGGGDQFQPKNIGQGPATTALSDNGSRVFFQSPDPFAGVRTCGPATGAQTDCPPQLFVRQYGSDGPMVRWISHSRSTPEGEHGYSGGLIAGQSIDQIGAGVNFQGASRDGRYVYFQTNAPLVPNDPNGGASITNGSASTASWDLYRYELPASLDADPDSGTLLRVSGGPGGGGDPNTNPHTESNGFDNGAALRYLSDDGKRAYFVTGAPIAGADSSAPLGGATTPGTATSAGSGTSRNLYLFDADETGAARYRFIARLPFGTDGMSACASWGKKGSFGLFQPQGGQSLAPTTGSCFRGTPDGRHVAFFTDGQLTTDDADTYGDVYLYDAAGDELVRVSAPPPGAEPYMCNGLDINAPVTAASGCNADLGPKPSAGLGGTPVPGGFAGLRHYNISENPDGTASVLFNSRSELVPEDTNGNYYDVYEWREGELRLVSPGNTADNSWYSGNSVSGRDVFIWTSARIDPREIDDADFDIYDARIGGGFPPPVVTQPCDVLALGCEGRALPVPVAPAPRTGATGPSQNVNPGKPRCRKGKVRRRGRCVKVKSGKPRCAKGKVRRAGRCVKKSRKHDVNKKRGSRAAGKHKGGSR